MLESMFELPVLAPEGIRRLSRREYGRMVNLGMFEDERVELLHGVLVTMSPQGGRHAGITAWLHQRLIRALDGSYDVRGHSPFAASDDSEPEPDISVSLRSPGAFEHPVTALLLIEIADSSLSKDRRVKSGIYAAAGVPEYWILDISGDELAVEVRTEPAADGYGASETYLRGQVLRPNQLPTVAIAIAEIPWRTA